MRLGQLTDPPPGGPVLLHDGGVGEGDAPAGAPALPRVQRARLRPEDRVRRLHREVRLEVLRVHRRRHRHVAVRAGEGGACDLGLGESMNQVSHTRYHL